MANAFQRIVNKVNNGPQFLRSFLLTQIFCRTVKFAGTAKVKILAVSNQSATLFLANKSRVQNHIGGIHAIAATLIAESATGIVVGMNVPDDRQPVLKSMKARFVRRMQGDLTAQATLSDEQVTQINQQEKGETWVSVLITDQSGQQPVEVEMEWAWVPKRR